LGLTFKQIQQLECKLLKQANTLEQELKDLLTEQFGR